MLFIACSDSLKVPVFPGLSTVADKFKDTRYRPVFLPWLCFPYPSCCLDLVLFSLSSSVSQIISSLMFRLIICISQCVPTAHFLPVAAPQPPSPEAPRPPLASSHLRTRCTRRCRRAVWAAAVDGRPARRESMFVFASRRRRHGTAGRSLYDLATAGSVSWEREPGWVRGDSRRWDEGMGVVSRKWCVLVFALVDPERQSSTLGWACLMYALQCSF